jgi:hypothetical protein
VRDECRCRVKLSGRKMDKKNPFEWVVVNKDGSFGEIINNPRMSRVRQLSLPVVNLNAKSFCTQIVEYIK